MVDKIIIGAGLYGLYSALYCAKKGQRVTVLEMDGAAFSRATYINQARVHMGYHYPRSLATAQKSAGYFKRFVEDYSFCIHSRFQQVYATSRHFSWTDAKEFVKFCQDAGIPCEVLPVERYFREGSCDGAFLTEEYTYDAHILRDFFLEELRKQKGVELLCQRDITRILKREDRYEIHALHQGKEERYEAPFVLNATYASVNQVLQLAGAEAEGSFEPFRIKYELCEIILCRVNDRLRDIGLTVMDGPFFSIMPFGKTGCHSLTSVTFTPHKTSHETVPRFSCMEGGSCGRWLGNCDACEKKPKSAWEYMSALARKYVREEYRFTYEKSLFSMKPILKVSEIDDSRPTVIRYATRRPTFISVLSGKINTVYDLDDFLDEK
ncbi:MAG: FAD-binding oxidoreductase [Lachnospiraceae bacterium]|nr:FAD-dependent oxidoreductase [uncultured Acetatifactor sp.]MCI9571004.1 FAD-binding oxidoreductase [Lachnospiraceae bacterium]